MNLCVVTSLFPSRPRPSEGIFAERRWAGMAARGHDVRVVHPRPHTPPAWTPLLPRRWAEIAAMPAHERRGALEVERPRYLHLPGRAVANARRFARRALAACLVADAWPPDAVVCDYAWPAAALAPELARRGVACVVSGRGSDVLEVAGEAGLGDHLARGLRAAGHWCAVSRDLLETMDRLGGAPGHGVLVPNGVDTTLFHPRERGPERARLGLGARGALVLVVGHLIPRKDPLLALAAFRAGAPANARLAFVGSGPLEAELRAAVQAAGLGARVELLGTRSPEQLARLLGAADLLLLTSRREGRPNVVLEALACGRPVLACDAGGTAELLGGPEGAAMLADSRDPVRLGAQLARLLAAPPAPEALCRLVEPLTWDAGLEALEAVIDAARAARRIPA